MSSRTNRGLPPARSPSVASSCSLSARSPAAASASCVTASGASGKSSTTSPNTSETNDGPSGCRVTTKSHGTGAAARVRCRRRKAEASSSQCASSITMRLGIISTRRRNCSTASWSRSCTKPASRQSVSGVGGTLALNGIASSGSHGARSGMIDSTHGFSCSPASVAVISGVIPASGLRRSCRAPYAVDDPYGSQLAVSCWNPTARTFSSSSRRDLPMPGSPTSSTSRLVRRRAESSASAKVSSSASRPTIGSSCARSVLPPSGVPTL